MNQKIKDTILFTVLLFASFWVLRVAIISFFRMEIFLPLWIRGESFSVEEHGWRYFLIPVLQLTVAGVLFGIGYSKFRQRRRFGAVGRTEAEAKAEKEKFSKLATQASVKGKVPKMPKRDDVPAEKDELIDELEDLMGERNIERKVRKKE